MAATELAPRVLWSPNHGPQSALIRTSCPDVFFGGARGGGKSDGLIGKWLRHAADHGKHANGIVFRRTYSELEQLQQRMEQIYSRLGAQWHASSRIWRFPNGSRLKLRYLERDADASRYQGFEHTIVFIDELGNFPNPDPIDKIRATLRSSVGIPVQMIATGNPGGPGQEWINERYVKPATPGEPFWDDAARTWRLFLPSSLNDNPALLENDPGYVDRLKGSGPPWLVKAWLEGDWNAVQGGDIFKAFWWQYFDLDAFKEEEALRVIWSWDTAFEKHNQADYCVGMLVAEMPNSYNILAVHRSKMEFPALKRKVQQLWDLFPADAMLIEKKASGASLYQDLKEITKIPIYPISPNVDKVARANAITPLVEQGKVKLPSSAPWLSTFINETSCFPNTAYDDQVDALTQALIWLQRHSRQSSFTYKKR